MTCLTFCAQRQLIHDQSATVNDPYFFSGTISRIDKLLSFILIEPDSDKLTFMSIFLVKKLMQFSISFVPLSVTV